MNKKSIAAIVLSLAVLLLWNVWYYNRYKDTIEANRQQAAANEAAQKDAATTPAVPVAAPAGAAPATATDPMAGLPSAKPVNARQITVDTGLARVALSNVGGVIESLQLARFNDEAGNSVELVDKKAALKPLALKFATDEATQKLNQTLFATDAPDQITLSEAAPSTSVLFYLKLENGVTIRKKLTFTRDSYVIGVETGVNVPGGNVTGSSYGLAWPALGGDKDSISYHGPVVLMDGKRLADAPDEKESAAYEGAVLWGGLTDKYFCAVLIPEAAKSKVVASQPVKGQYDITLEQPSNGAVNKLSLYAGPKDHVILDKEGHELERIISYGWFHIIAKPMYVALLWIYTLVGNYGWAIILLTVIIKLLFWPLTQSSFRSMEKMRKVQPLLKKIQERYKNDKAKLNEEMIALYRQHRINPLSGCLPILLQIPVFVALYKVLLESIELKGAPFMLWIHDLAAKDPYYVSPVLMGISMFLQQKMSPAATDPIQKNIMLLMPVVFTVMFINFPSGLVIYWLVNNLLSIVQQYMIRIQKQED